MKLERLAEYITIVVTIVVGIFVALYIGSSAGSGGSTPQLIIGGMVAVMIALILQDKIWLLIPMSIPFTGRLPVAPAGLGANHLAILYAFVVFLALKALKVVRTKAKYNWLDYLLFFNIIYIIINYIRNPVGTLSLGFEKVGGKPYIETIIALLAYWVINHVEITPKLATRLPLIMTIGAAFNGVIGLCVKIYHPLGSVLGKVYSDYRGYAAGAIDPLGYSTMERDLSSRNFGSILGMLYSYWSPLAILNPMPSLNPLSIWRFVVALYCMYAALTSGFRSAFFDIALAFIFYTFFRDGIKACIRIPVFVLPLLIIIIAAQGSLIQLPGSVQRSLCFLPGKWDPAVKIDAEGSTEWRMDIWQNVMSSGNKYIKDWWWGDGFGLTLDDLRYSQWAQADAKESLTITGDYHSLALSSIHIVGYIGFALLMIMMVGISVYAWKLIFRAKGTPFFSLALIVGVPLVYAPVYSLLIFGSYKYAVFGNIYAIAWLRLAGRGLEKYLLEKQETEEQPEETFPQLDISRFDPPLLRH